MSIPVNEVVLLQAVQDYGLRTIKETTDSAHREGRGRDGGWGGGKWGQYVKNIYSSHSKIAAQHLETRQDLSAKESWKTEVG